MPEERKLVTILFADVAGSTALGEALDPEDVRALMGRYYEHARHVVELHDGTLEKFIGDAVMAIFGLPTAHGDDAERAVAAALALRAAIDADSVLANRLCVRIGLNTGEVVASTETDRADFLITGDAVNVAARLQQNAEPGEILSGERTHAATTMAFEFAPSRPIEAKGKAEPLQAYAVLGQLSERPTGRPPLVGRRQDLALLNLLRDRALEERHPQFVSIVAPAGTGKTRLLEEFLDLLDPIDSFVVGTAKCLPYGQTLAYWPLRGLLESLANSGTVAAATPAGSTVASESAALRGGDIDPQTFLEATFASVAVSEDAARLVDNVLATLGVETGSSLQTERESIFNAWRLLIEALAQRSPLIVVFEDLHWASDSLLDLVEHVMHPRTQAPLVILGLTRPELLDRRPGWGGGRGNFSSLALEPLTEEQTIQLVTSVGGSLPASIRGRIADRSGGNPFFALELIRGLAERGIGRVIEDDAALPDTVHAAVLARLDLLSPLQRRVVQAASVFGRTFRSASLASLLEDVPRGEIDNVVDSLLTRDLIVSAEADTFTFRHILTRDVAYGTLSRVERIRMHGAIASWLEEFAAGRVEEFVPLIAYHYYEAAALGRRGAVIDATPIDTRKAVEYLERAGIQSGLGGAFVEAQTHLRNAIELAPEDEKGPLYEKLGDVASFGDAAVAAYGEALARWRSDPSANLLVGARLLRKVMIIQMRWQGSVTRRLTEQEMGEQRSEAMRLAESAGDETEIWRLRVADLFLPFWRSQISPDEAVALIERADAAAEFFAAREEWDMVHTALDGYQGIAREIGDHEARRAAVERRIKIPVVDQLEWGDAMNMVAWAHSEAGRYDECVDFVLAAARELRPGQPTLHLVNGFSIAGCTAMYCGRWADADTCLDYLMRAWEELRRDESAGFLIFGFGAAMHLGNAREDRQASEGATAILRTLLNASEMRGDQAIVVDAYERDDPTLLQSGDFQVPGTNSAFVAFGLNFCLERGVIPAERIVSRAREGAESGRHPLNIHAVAVADALASGDDNRLRTAIDAADESGLKPTAARMRIVLASRTGDRAPLDQARPVLEHLGDRQFLRRLQGGGGISLAQRKRRDVAIRYASSARDSRDLRTTARAR